LDRFVAALERRHVDALPAFFDDALRVVHHTSGSAYGRREMLVTWRSALRAEHLEFRRQAIASLGDTLVLNRQVTAVEGLREAHLADFGSTEVDEISLVETDAAGRWIDIELFAPDRLGAAVVRLYERHAAQQVEGSERARAAAVAHAALAMMGPIDLDRMAAAFAPEFRLTDHRVLATWSAETGAELVAHFRHHLELAPDFAPRIDDVLALDTRALVARVTFVGTARDSGGAFENRCCVLYRFGDDGRIAEIDCFEAEQETEALARCEALFDGAPAEAARDPFENAALRTDRLLFESFNARDWPGIDALAAPDLVFDERRRMLRNRCGRDVWLEQFRVLFDVPASRFTTEPRATRGERLALSLHRFEGEVPGGGGPLAMDDHLVLHEVDRDGRIVAIVLFDLEDEDAAYADLDARFEADASQAHARRTVAFDRAIARRDWEAVAALCSPAFVEHDHRSLAVLGTTRGAEAWMQNFRALVELAPDTIYRTLHARGGARGFLSVGAWLGSREGGRYEIPLLAVCEVDARGAIARADLYEPDQRDQALARFRELEAAAPVPFANAATRTLERACAAFTARDWAEVGRLTGAEFRMYDRTALAQAEADRDEWLASFRHIIELTEGPFVPEILATRDERLAVARLQWHGAGDDVGPSEIHWLIVYEVNPRGEVTAIVSLDPSDLEAAWAELDARWQAGEGAAQVPAALAFLTSFDPALARRDWDAVVAGYAPSFVGVDHRLVGWGTLQGPAAFLEAFRTLVALAPDVRLRWDHGRTSSRGLLAQATWLGTRDGGAFENPFLMVGEFSADGRILRADFYDVHHVDRAQARFQEIESAAPPPASPFANAASRAADENWAHCMAGDWDSYARSFPAHFRLSDRRRNVQLELGRDETIAFSRSLAEHATTGVIHAETLATRGERLALQRWRIELAGDDAGPSEISHLNLMELDEHGLRKAVVRWDDDAIDAAWAELDARFEAGEGAAHPYVAGYFASGAAIRSRDWDALAAVCAPKFRMRDHRLLGWGTMANDTATFVRVIQSAVELAPDARYRDDHVRICARGTLVGSALCGTREGGAFESPFLRVTEVDAQSRILSHDLYEMSDFARALARFEEIRAGDSRDPHATTPNAASAAMDRWAAAYDVGFDTGDWEPMRALCAPGHVFDDRRRLALLSGDRELMIASARERVAMGARPQRRLLGSAGERVAVETILWSGGPSDGPFEIEYVGVIEADAAGLISAFVLFDADDGRAAQREAWARWAAIEPEVAATVSLVADLCDGFDARDGTRVRSLCADDLVYEDHRRTGVGRIDGAAAFVESLEVLWELAPATAIEFGRSWPGLDRHGAVTVIRRYGTLPDGGAFESEYLELFVAAHGRATHLELFELEQLDAALARLAELRPDPLAIPPNAATRARERWSRAVVARDWDAVRRLVAPGFVFEDRGRRALVRGDVETWIASADYTTALPGVRIEIPLVATTGDRVSIDEIRWAGSPEGDGFEFGRLRVLEVDGEGRFRAALLFDPEDRAAAFAEAQARFLAGEAAGCAAQRLVTASYDAFFRRDLAVFRERLVAPDFVYEDRRTIGLGRYGRDDYVESLRALLNLAADVAVEELYTLAWNEHGRVVVNRLAGTFPGGGPFERPNASVWLARDGRLARYETFESADAERALARFAELCARFGDEEELL
jgi:ketosteroid isomerase-like protein